MKSKIKSYNPIFIYGSTGVGKTYLLKTIVRSLAKIKHKIETLSEAIGKVPQVYSGRIAINSDINRDTTVKIRFEK